MAPLPSVPRRSRPRRELSGRQPRRLGNVPSAHDETRPRGYVELITRIVGLLHGGVPLFRFGHDTSGEQFQLPNRGAPLPCGVNGRGVAQHENLFPRHGPGGLRLSKQGHAGFLVDRMGQRSRPVDRGKPKQKRVNLLDGRRVFDVGIEAPFVPPHRQVASLSSLIGKRRGQQGPQGTDDHAEQGGQLIEKTVHGKSLPKRRKAAPSRARGPDGSSSVRVDSRLIASEAELVSLGVGQDEPGLAELLPGGGRDTGRAQPLQALDLGFDVVDEQVEVQPVLHGLRFRYPLESEHDAVPGQRDVPVLDDAVDHESGGGLPECRGPPKVATVEGELDPHTPDSSPPAKEERMREESRSTAPGRVRYRAAGPDDAGSVARLHADSWRRHYRGTYADAYLDGDILTDRRAVWSARLAAAAGTATLPATATLLAEDDTGPVGFVHVVFDDDDRWGSLVDNLHVAPGRQRAGIGSGMLHRYS